MTQTLPAPPDIYKVQAAIETVCAAIAAQDGEILPAQDEILSTLLANLETGAEGIALYTRNLKTYAAACDAAVAAYANELHRLETLSEQRKKVANTLLEKVKQAMLAAGVHKIETPLIRLTVVQNGLPAISFNGDMESLPAELVRITKSFDGKAAHAAVKEGKELPAGITVNYGTHLRIK